MISRRDFVQAALATSALVGTGTLARRARAQQFSEDGLIDMAPLGNVTLIHVTDIHAQLRPLWFRE
ncbi:MAG: twin-arginine translocation signal domain-containing protein, partial [Pseudomonadota bacterium]